MKFTVGGVFDSFCLDHESIFKGVLFGGRKETDGWRWTSGIPTMGSKASYLQIKFFFPGRF